METTSPISSRYQLRINTNIKKKTNESNHHEINESLLFDRLSPTNKGLNKYSTSFFNSPRFIYSGNHDINRTNINTNLNRSSLSLSTSARKRERKLMEIYYGRSDAFYEHIHNEDISLQNERIRQRTAIQTYNHCLKSELFEIDTENNNNNDNNNNNNIDDRNNDCNRDYNDIETDEDSSYCAGIDNLSLSTLPSLPSYRSSQKEILQNVAINKHHPLCPHFKIIEKHNNKIQQKKNGLVLRENIRVNSETCHCQNITPNCNINFLSSPQRTLQYRYNESNNNKIDNVINIKCSPLTESTKLSLFSKRQKIRSIPKVPYKILDAPQLTDDFYLNLVSWSASCNILSVGLADCVYLWNPLTTKVTKLCDLNQLNLQNINIDTNDNTPIELDTVCSVDWNIDKDKHSVYSSIFNNNNNNNNNQNGNNDTNQFINYLGVGTNLGCILVYDVMKSEIVHNLHKHNHRVGVLSWKNNNILASGSRDRNIFLRDIRQSDDIIDSLCFHKQEVCGLKWNYNQPYYLASGGNDNRLAIWDIRNCIKPFMYGKHRAAIKALCWSPTISHLLCSGGGTADRCIKFWNINTSNNNNNNNNNDSNLMQATRTIDTGSQVCNLHWNKNVDEIVSTHGYSLNQVIVWRFPSMEKQTVLTGHTLRVLYLCVSPDGQTIVTGAADQTLRLWSIFPPSSQTENDTYCNSNFIR